MDPDPAVTEEQLTEAPPTVSRRVVFWVLVAGCIAGAFVTIVALSRGQQTPNEALLLSILLTFLSVAAGWLITHTFYQDDRRQQIAAVRREYEQSLEVYAVKASEKLINLSNQIGRLIDFMEGENYASYGEEKESYRLLCERQRATTHMLHTLRSMNDTSLSDWEGVIGDRLDAKRRLDEQRNYDINELLETMRDATKSEVNSALSEGELGKYIKELRSLTTSGSSLPPAHRALSVVLSCPVCAKSIRLKTNSKGFVRKTAATCTACGTQLAIIDGKTANPYLSKRERKAEAAACAYCSVVTPVLLDNVSPAQSSFRCGACGQVSVAHRTLDGILVKAPPERQPPPASITDEHLLDRVLMLLPRQPWPTGVHRDIAAKLDVTPTLVGKVIQELIKQGRVHHQIDGIVIATGPDSVDLGQEPAAADSPEPLEKPEE